MSTIDGSQSVRRQRTGTSRRATGRDERTESGERTRNMHARINMLAGDPAMPGDAARHLEETARPPVESQRGNRGIACLVNADLGTCVIASYWDSADAMPLSEQ